MVRLVDHPLPALTTLLCLLSLGALLMGCQCGKSDGEPTGPALTQAPAAPAISTAAPDPTPEPTPPEPEPGFPFPINALTSEGLCEASAIVLSPWSPNRFLIADNEVHDKLFVFRREGGELIAEPPLPLPDGGPRDIEALAVHEAKGVPALTIVGSHSKSRTCEGKRKRRRVMTVARREGELVVLGDVEAIVPNCVQGSPLCGVADDCLQTDIEAAARDHEGALWFGFRTPPGLLMRRLPRGKRRYAQLATRGRGVRGLTQHQGRLVGLLGPSEDSESHQLFIVEPGVLQSGQRMEGLAETPIGRTHEVPTFTEGVVIDRDGGVVIVIDGQNGSGSECTQPARYAILPSLF